jgi:hypothetical protein
MLHQEIEKHNKILEKLCGRLSKMHKVSLDKLSAIIKQMTIAGIYESPLVDYLSKNSGI